jgi:hypothetical protein
MVSIPMVVLPVWRSPIINSRCPRPTGIKPSMALIPVYKALFTDCLEIIPGALRSTNSVVVAGAVLISSNQSSPAISKVTKSKELTLILSLELDEICQDLKILIFS